MQATAPGRSLVLQAGQTVVAEVTDGPALALAGRVLSSTGGRACVGTAALTANTAGSWDSCLASRDSLHAGHRMCLPAALSGIRISLLQWGQRITCGMAFDGEW